MNGRCSTLWKASHKAEHLPPRPTTPYPFGQIKHLAYKVEGNLGGLPYNYQVVGKHPVTRFSSLTFQPHTRSAGRASTLARLYFNGRAVVGEPQGSPVRWNAGLLTLLRARSPTFPASVGRSEK